MKKSIHEQSRSRSMMGMPVGAQIGVVLEGGKKIQCTVMESKGRTIIIQEIKSGKCWELELEEVTDPRNE